MRISSKSCVMKASERMGASPSAVTVALFIHSPERQRKSLNWFARFRHSLNSWIEIFSRYKWDSTSGIWGVTGVSALIADVLYSVNGCSMKTEANLAAVKAIPPGKIMFETGQPVPDLMPQFTF